MDSTITHPPVIKHRVCRLASRFLFITTKVMDMSVMHSIFCPLYLNEHCLTRRHALDSNVYPSPSLPSQPQIAIKRLLLVLYHREWREIDRAQVMRNVLAGCIALCSRRPESP